MKVRNAATLLVGALGLGALVVTSRYSYLLFHTLVELFTVVVAAGVFVVAWNARRDLDNNYLLFVGIASIFVALLDLFHALAYEGMGVLRGSTADEATQLWLAGRSLQAFSVLAAPLFLGRRLPVRLLVSGLGLATAALLASILVWPVFPTAYVAGAGLTPFKVVAEYALAAAFGWAALLLVRRPEWFDEVVRRRLVAWLLLTMLAELAFTAYVGVYDAANLGGHLLRLVATFLLYKAVLERGFVQPHALLVRELKRSEERLREYADALEEGNEELRRSEARLRERALDLESRNQELDAFARTVAHDLKTPLSVIVSSTDLLRRVEAGGLDPAWLEERAPGLLDRIRATAFDMGGIIDALLLLAEVRKVDAPRDRLDMATIVEKVVARYAELIEETGGTVTVADGWPRAEGYAPWVEEVWSNYLSNALRHGGPRPRVELGADPPTDGTTRFWVRDHGPGVAPEARGRLFIPFRALGGAEPGGHGLGLSIVLQIVEKLGGEVGFDSEPGAGSTFYFTLSASPGPSPEGDGGTRVRR